MLLFEPSDPFPLIDLSSVSYAEQQEHSAAADTWLGMETYAIEERLALANQRAAERPRGDKYWIGLPVEALLTPYVELRFILDKLAVTSGRIADLGAGYGRMGFVIARHFPGVTFQGIEIVPERVAEGAKALLKFEGGRGGMLIEGDLTKMSLPIVGVYFIYDYGSARAIEQSLGDLREISMTRSITVVGRGGSTRDAIEKKHPWLSGINSPEHFPHFSIYRS